MNAQRTLRKSRTVRRKRNMGPAITIKKRQEIPTRGDIKQIIKREMGKTAENKNHNYENFEGNVTAVGTVIYLTDVLPLVEGSPSVHTREGLQITPSWLALKYLLRVADTYNVVRVIIFQWNSDTSPITTDIIDTVTAGGGEMDVMGQYNVGKKDLRYILYDKIHVLDTEHQTLVQQVNINLSTLKSKKWNKIMNYRENGAVSPHGFNDLHMLVISDSLATSHPQINIVSRFFFKDD